MDSLIWAGYNFREPYGGGGLSDDVPLTAPAVHQIRNFVDRSTYWEDRLMVREYGLFPALGGMGILLVILGFVVMRFSKRYFVGAYEDDKGSLKQVACRWKAFVEYPKHPKQAPPSALILMNLYWTFRKMNGRLQRH